MIFNDSWDTFEIFFGIKFRHHFWHAFFPTFLMENYLKMAPISRCRLLRFWHLFRDLFQRSISVACGNSSAPGPREDSLHAKICKKFNTRVNAGVFFYKFLP